MASSIFEDVINVNCLNSDGHGSCFLYQYPHYICSSINGSHITLWRCKLYKQIACRKWYTVIGLQTLSLKAKIYVILVCIIIYKFMT